jgi:hypothetical protein
VVSDQAPERISVTMYQVGFGDCFLLSFHYPNALDDGRNVRHMLIDYGSTHAADGTELEDIAELIATHTEGTLDVIVVSHRHRDHISGFGSTAAQASLASFTPRMVLRPWTEDPRLASNADGPTLTDDDVDSRYVGTLAAAQGFVQKLDQHLQLTNGTEGASSSLVDALHAEVQMSLGGNDNAIRVLDAWAEVEGVANYASYRTPVDLEHIIPGVDCTVLGPPLIRDYSPIKSERYDDAHEFWLVQDQLPSPESLQGNATSRTDPQVVLAGRDGLGPAHWLMDRLSGQRNDQLLDLVEQVDHALNNTSLILLITAGERRMLFPGDAQIEDWQYVLDKDPKALTDLDLYKVGHHGSRNATPRTLVGMWNGTPLNPMVALMSTKSGVHGQHGPNPVPKDELVEALVKRMTLHSTDDLRPGERFLCVDAPSTRDGTPFQRVP